MIFKVKESELKAGKATVPSNLLISDIRIVGPSRYRYRSYGRGTYEAATYYLSKKALKSLNQAGYITVSDLEGVSQKVLEKLSHIGSSWAKRLELVGQRSDSDARGEGFPWEIPLILTIPTPVVGVLAAENKDDVLSALGIYFSNLVNWELDILDIIKDAKAAKLRKEIDRHRDTIDVLNQQIKELNTKSVLHNIAQEEKG